ncbi:unnamed protein product [Closterium sp. NIES-65]|nr:unnamed protein product [Closterium sp. NIES-65]
MPGSSKAPTTYSGLGTWRACEILSLEASHFGHDREHTGTSSGYLKEKCHWFWSPSCTLKRRCSLLIQILPPQLYGFTTTPTRPALTEQIAGVLCTAVYRVPGMTRLY